MNLEHNVYFDFHFWKVNPLYNLLKRNVAYIWTIWITFFQAGNLVGLYSMGEPCLTMTLKKMPWKVARAALKFQFVKSKVSLAHYFLSTVVHSSRV